MGANMNAAAIDRAASQGSPPAGTGTGTMRSIVQEAYGTEPEEVLRVAEVALPAIADDEVRIKVAAASIDRGTWHVMAGRPYVMRVAGFGIRAPKAANPGRSVAGTVDMVGAKVTGFRVGDEVYGIARSSFAEFAVADPAKLARRPASLSFAEAAAVPVSGLTALQAVRDRGKVEAGQSVLVIGASGGVGSFAVQIAKAYGAEVTAVSSTAKAGAVTALGADHVIDYSREDFAAGGHRYDVILDIGGRSSLARLRRALAPRGTLVIVGGTTGPGGRSKPATTGGRWFGGIDRQLRAQLLSLVVGQKLGSFVSSENAEDLAALAGLIDAGQVAPAVDRAYPLAEVPAAIRHLLDGRAVGKLVVTV
jgi:NADPH:quinone reductase-like Zn-dependent oxidoreductase